MCDQHALEVFLTTFLILFVVLMFKKHWLWSIGAGIILGLYYLSWAFSNWLVGMEQVGWIDSGNGVVGDSG